MRRKGPPKGVPKTPESGRKKGSLNKKTLAIRARVLRDEELSVAATVEAIRRGQQYDSRRLLNARGNFRPLQTLSEEDAWCIAGAEVIIKNAEAGDGHTDRVLKLKFVDRGRYVELAARHQGMLADKLDVTVQDSRLEARLHAGRERVRLAGATPKALPPPRRKP